MNNQDAARELLAAVKDLTASSVRIDGELGRILIDSYKLENLTEVSIKTAPGKEVQFRASDIPKIIAALKKI